MHASSNGGSKSDPKRIKIRSGTAPDSLLDALGTEVQIWCGIRQKKRKNHAFFRLPNRRPSGDSRPGVFHLHGSKFVCAAVTIQPQRHDSWPKFSTPPIRSHRKRPNPFLRRSETLCTISPLKFDAKNEVLVRD